jgi:hypothetical protein
MKAPTVLSARGRLNRKPSVTPRQNPRIDPACTPDRSMSLRAVSKSSA